MSAVFDANAPITLTYNLTVADFHTYFVGEDGVLVHNGRGAAWRAIHESPNTAKWIKGWIQQELNSGRSYSRVRSPRSCDLGHYPSNRRAHNNRSRPEAPRDNRRRPHITGNNSKWR